MWSGFGTRQWLETEKLLKSIKEKAQISLKRMKSRNVNFEDPAEEGFEGSEGWL